MGATKVGRGMMGKAVESFAAAFKTKTVTNGVYVCVRSVLASKNERNKKQKQKHHQPMTFYHVTTLSNAAPKPTNTDAGSLIAAAGAQPLGGCAKCHSYTHFITFSHSHCSGGT